MKLMNFINERYLNLFKDDRKDHVDDVWNIIHSSYESCGGIKGSGFSSKEDMLQKIPFWKLVKKNNKIVAVILYKDKKGRKLVALGSDGTAEGKTQVKKMLKDDLITGRSYGEVSHAVLKVLKRMFTQKELDLYLVPSNDAVKNLNMIGKDAIAVSKYEYSRSISDEDIVKVMFGKMGQPILPNK